MLSWALTVLIVAVIASVFCFGGIYAAVIDIARSLFYVFTVLFVVSLISGRASLGL